MDKETKLQINFQKIAMFMLRIITSSALDRSGCSS